MLVQYLKADILKTRRLSLRMAHLVIPVGTAVLFVAYYSFSAGEESVKIEAFYQVLGLALPVLCGMFCSMFSEQEAAAGAFQSMLMVQKKYIPFLSKLILLLFWELGALLLVSALFGAGFTFILGNHLVPIRFYFLVSVHLWGSSIVLYILHLFLAFQCRKGISIGLGIVESLVSGLFLTDMGKYVWTYVPVSWPARIPTTFIQAYTGEIEADVVLHEMLPVWGIFTALSMVCYVVWSSRWERIKTVD